MSQSEVKDTPEQVRAAFAAADTIHFLSRPINHFKFRMIAFGGKNYLLWYVMPILGVTPQILSPIFNEGRVVERYEELDSFVTAHEPFKKLSKILGKTLNVQLEMGSGGYDFLFMVSPSGEVDDRNPAFASV